MSRLPLRLVFTCIAISWVAACSGRQPVLPLYLPPPTTPYGGPVGIPTSSELPNGTPAQAEPKVDDHGEISADKPEQHPAEPVALDEGLARGVRYAAQGSIPSRGVVRALVLPVSLGGARPTWDEERIANEVFGRGGLAAEVLRLSGGQLRLEADIFPPLVESTLSEVDVVESLNAESNLRDLGLRLVREWSRRANLAQYDNDGPDGRPMSGDDDGNIDLLYIVIETSGYPALMTLPLNMDVPVGRNGRLTLKADFAHVLPLPPTGGDVRVAFPPEFRLLQFLGSLGIEPGHARFPEPLADEVSTATRVSLGWVKFVEVGRKGRYTLGDGVLVLPGPGRDRLWMVERDSRGVVVSEVRRLGSGMETLSAIRYDDPLEPIMLRATTDEGLLEAVVGWNAGDPVLNIELRERS